jgi:hypothetical protein
MYKLPIDKVIVGAFLMPWWNRRVYSTALVLPTLLSCAVWIFIVLSSNSVSMMASWLYYFLYIMCFSIFAVTCHRLILVEHSEHKKGIHLSFTSREIKFFVWVVGIYIFIAIIQMIPMTIYYNYVLQYGNGGEVIGVNSNALVQFIISIPAMYVLGRLSLVFPAVAIDKPISLSRSWSYTRNNGLRMFFIVGLFPAILSVMLGAFTRDEATLIEQVILGFVFYLIFAIEIFALSLSYKEIIPNCETYAGN